MAREEARGKRPFKIWDSWRNVRKSLVVSSFEELLVRGREKLGVSSGEAVRVVLESDGTQVEDGDYFRTLPPNTVLLLLRQGETWGPVGGVDVIRAAISAIPKIVCETIHALELHRDETPSPSWKIMDNKGRVTVVLHWDHPQHHYQPPPPSSRSHPRNSSTTAPSPSLGLGPDGAVDVASASMTRPSLVIHGAGTTTVGRDGKKETLINDVYTPARYGGGGGGTSPQITVINHDAATARAIGSSYGGAAGSGGTTGGSSVGGVHHPPRLSRQGSGGSSFESGAAIHVHTAECSAHHLHHPMHSSASSPPAPSPSGHDPQGPHQHGGGVTECDFHCCALHEEGRRIAVHKSVATSPIQDHAQSQDGGAAGARASRGAGLAPPSTTGKQHVRFLDIESGVEGAVPRGGSPMGGSARPPAVVPVTTAMGTSPGGGTSSAGESSESETETTLLEEEGATSEKFLLLVDQPASMDARRHLTIKDIGVILERLRSKIVDVERLERDSDGGTGGSGGGGTGDGAGSGRGGAGAGGAGSGSDDCHNWTIKATIRGETLRELGVIYNGNYYAISEHPGYRAEGNREEEEGDGEEVEDDDEEEEEDRL